MSTSNVTRASDWRLWFNQPAEHWYDGLPLANGRMGAMVYGGVRVERIYLSETPFWSGEPSQENSNPQGPVIFQRARALLLARDIAAADELAHELEGRKLNYGTNLPFGNLRLLFDHEQIGAHAYRRELDMDTATARIQYRFGETDYQRHIFVSAPHQVMVIRLTCSDPAGLTFRIILDGDEQPFDVHSDGTDTLLMDNQAREFQHSNGKVGVDGHARLKVASESGQIISTGSQLTLEQADSATIFLTMRTTFDGNDPVAQCQEDIQAASSLAYEVLRSTQLSEYQQWYRRTSLDLGLGSHPDWPLDQRIQTVRQGEDDTHLCALLFQFGRYLLISSSHPDSPLPASLTGAWNDNRACRIGWTCDYHLDINTQMNYWIAELTNLSECHQPLFRWIEQTLVPSGRHTARNLYDMPGWVAHVVSNPLGIHGLGLEYLVGSPPYGRRVGGGAPMGSLCFHPRSTVSGGASLSHIKRSGRILPGLSGQRFIDRLAGKRPLQFAREYLPLSRPGLSCCARTHC